MMISTSLGLSTRTSKPMKTPKPSKKPKPDQVEPKFPDTKFPPKKKK